MHIAIDAHSVGAQLAGNETYAVNLIEALAEIDQTNQYTLFVTTREAIDRFANRWPNFKARQTLPHTPLVRIPLTLSAELRRHPVDVLHVQYTAPPLPPCPVVTTIHDLSFEHLPETFRRRSRTQLRLTVRRTARKAALILTLSEFSRKDIIETYAVDPERVLVTPAAAPPGFAPLDDETKLKEIRKRYGINANYLFALGSIQPRKNLTRLIEAYASLRRARPRDDIPQLVIGGKRGWLDREVFRAAQQDDLKDSIRFIGYVAEENLPALYTGATCFVYPSYFEGFGLTVVEAMQCGAPVIAGNKTSIPEIAGGAALLLDPFDTAALAEAIGRVIDNPDYRAELRVKGLQRAAEFNWITTARSTLKAYERAATKQRITK